MPTKANQSGDYANQPPGQQNAYGPPARYTSGDQRLDADGDVIVIIGGMQKGRRDMDDEGGLPKQIAPDDAEG